MTQGIFPPPAIISPSTIGTEVISTLQMTSATNVISNIPQTYKSLYLVLSNLSQNSNATTNSVQVGTNSVNTTASTIGGTTYFYPTSTTATGYVNVGIVGTDGGKIPTGPISIVGTERSYLEMFFPQYTQTDGRFFAKGFSARTSSTSSRYFDANWAVIAPITSITIYAGFPFATGTATLYGVK
jgi:hypothetical protein